MPKSNKTSRGRLNTYQQDTKCSAGGFLDWIRQVQAVLDHSGTIGVSCGDCRACCRSSYFIHINPAERRTLDVIPKDLLFKAPGFSKGEVLLGYDHQGRCPMLHQGGCSIYPDRPQTCRSFDCRIFPATGIFERADRALVRRQSHRWEFDYPSADDTIHHAALRAAAGFLIKQAKYFPAGFVPRNTVQQAFCAIKTYEVFLQSDTIVRKPIDADKRDSIVKAMVGVFHRG